MGQILQADSIGAVTIVGTTLTLAPSVLTCGGQQYITASLNLSLSGLSASTTYNIFAVSVSNVVSLVKDTNSAPVGYTAYKLVYVVSTDSNGVISNKNQWQPSKSYIVGDIVERDGFSIRCFVDHISSSDYNADMGLGYWKLAHYEKNHYINGNFDFFQRSTAIGVIGLGSHIYVADRTGFTCGNSVSATYTHQQNPTVPTLAQSGFKSTNALQVYPNPGNVLGNSTSYCMPFVYIMEGNDYAAVHGKRVTLSFWIFAALAGQYTVAFRKDASPYRTFIAPFTVNQANTLEFKAITLQLDNSSSNWAFDTAAALDIMICATSGSTFVTSTVNSWIDGNYLTASGTVDPLHGNGANNGILISQVMLNLGPAPNPTFVRAGTTIAEELILCQRYFEKSYQQSVVPGTSDYPDCSGNLTDVSGRLINNPIQFKVQKRISPNVVLYSQTGTPNRVTPVGGGDAGSGTWYINHGVNCVWDAENSSALTGYSAYYFNWTADSEF